MLNAAQISFVDNGDCQLTGCALHFHFLFFKNVCRFSNAYQPPAATFTILVVSQNDYI